ncbi:Fic family protein [Rheinheimera soli]|uniref:Fic family protein n=1 Tax=Rheinheimera soli TaxID=443616 RepID=A0ABU1W1J4_9GAMM|nr:Fic family protein [Rheinheimera soli]MDR7121834.1 Fic family protein [Rheinheimera soli]
MIKHPPHPVPDVTSVITDLSAANPEQIPLYLSHFRSVDEQGRYLHFDELRFRVAKELNPEWVWAFVKSCRLAQQQPLLALGEPAQNCSFMLTPIIQKAVSFTDRYSTKTVLENISRQIGEAQQFEYLLNDLIQDEAISSSQLEGAATTTLVAKEMLQTKRKARTADEKMIIGNFQMMQWAWEQRHKSLNLEFITELHRIGVEGIADEKYTPGVFRQTDDVVVMGRDGEVLHQPPAALGIVDRLQLLCDWLNTCHDSAESPNYIHPLVKAIVLHFAIGYEHPFRDGNGRVARALFYWFMFKNDYAAFRYIAISLLLKKAPVKYGKSYLHSETDQLDLTYFIDYQCSIVLRAIEDYRAICEQNIKENEAFLHWLWSSGIYQKLNEKQKIVFQVARSGSAKLFTANNVKENLGCSYNTAATVLNELVELELFSKVKEGREWVYRMLDKQQIQHRWGM